MSCHFTYITTHSPTLLSLYLRHSSFSNPSVASHMLQFILQPFFHFSNVKSSLLNSPGEPPMVIELSRHSYWLQGSVHTVCELSHADLQAFLAPLLQLFQPKPKANQNAVRYGHLYVHTWTLWHTFTHFWRPYTVAHRLHITDDEYQWG